MALFLTACTEKGPAIDFGTVKATDTSYTAPVETAQPRVALVEEATGVTCPNCPEGAALIESFYNNNPGRVVAIGMHAGSFASPLPISTKDFRSEAAANLFAYFGGEPGGKPAATFDRTLSNGDYFIIARSQWAAKLASQLAIPTVANVLVNSTWDATKGEAVIRVRSAFTQPVSRNVHLSVALTESGMVDAQENGSTIDTNYTHKHVLRELLTPASGTQILSGTSIQPGQVYERTFIYKPKDGWNPAQMEVVAFLHYSDQDGKEVIQAAHAGLE